MSKLPSNYFILCDSTSKLEEISNISKKFNAQIITFDNYSHNFFLKKNIVHTLSDDYLCDEDLDSIQDLTYDLSNWYAEPEISNFIKFEEINIGELFYLELGRFLPPILKKIFEIQKIVKKHKDASYISSPSMIEFIKLFSSNFKILLDDNIINHIKKNNELSVKLGNIKIKSNSKNSFLKNAVGFSYDIFNRFFSSQKIDSQKPTILLINFTTLRMQQLFEELPNYNVNLIKYDTNAPAFWNFTTFTLIRKSGCLIENNETILKNNDFNFLKKQELIIPQKLNELLKNESFFKRFFSLDTQSFWHIIKNDFIEMFSRNYKNALKDIARIEYLFQKYSVSFVILLSEADPLDLVILHIAKKLGIKTGILQHALYYDDLQNLNYYNFKSDQFQRVLPKRSDNFFVWGKITQHDSINHGIPDEKIISIGSPFFDNFLNENPSLDKLRNKYILLATTPTTSKNQTKELSIKIQNEYMYTLQEICRISSNLNENLLIKLHHGSTFNEKEIVKKINPNITVENIGSFYQYVKDCKILICIDITTGILEAMLLKKPIILVLINDKVSYPEILQNNYLITTPISELESILKKFDDESFKNSVLKNQEIFLNNYLEHIGTSSKILLSFLEKRKIY